MLKADTRSAKLGLERYYPLGNARGFSSYLLVEKLEKLSATLVLGQLFVFPPFFCWLLWSLVFVPDMCST